VSARRQASARAQSASPVSAASSLSAITAEVVERVRCGDVRAFDMLAREAFEPLARFAYGFVQNTEVAEDIVQDVLAYVWQLGARWRAPAPVAYLFAAVRNGALKVLRHSEVESRHVHRVQQQWLPDETTSRLLGPEELVLWREQVRLFDEVLNSLTERQRTAFILRYEQGMTVPAIAQTLGISTKGAEKLVSRVTHLLRTRLDTIR
jgi:RNA polymerase sigma-70 factor (ECF subfamily)